MRSKPVFESLNGLRGVAAMMVVAFHWSLANALPLHYGFLAVDLFFVISGFVIAAAYEARLRSDLSLAQFFAIRFIRLYPLYIMGTGIAFAVAMVSFVLRGGVSEANVPAFAAAPYATLMAPAPPLHGADATLYPLNPAAWSLFFELIANLVYAASPRFWTMKKLVAVMAGCALFLLASPNFYGGGGVFWSSIALGLARVFYSFFAGVAIFRLYEAGVRLQGLPASLVIVAFFGLLVAPYAIGVAPVGLIGLPLLVAFAVNANPSGALRNVFADLGLASYAVYALHAPLHGLMIAVLARLHVDALISADIALWLTLAPLGLLAARRYDAPVRARLTGAFNALHRAAFARQRA
ncbi:MAG: acyltransferase [Hyphomicrobiales bacterium]|nr:acyltransferase [Hyphomicrobiales bacterium]